MDYRDYLELKEHPPSDLHLEIKEGIRLGYSKKLSRFFINNVCSEPLDSWGIDWGINQSAVMLYPEELDLLIEKLKILRKQDES